EEEAGGLCGGGRQIECGTVHQEDVEPAVIIVVDEGDSAAHLLDQIFLVLDRARNVASVPEARLRGNIGELRGVCGASDQSGGKAEKHPARHRACLPAHWRLPSPRSSFRNSRRFCSNSFDSRSSLTNVSIVFLLSSILPSLR